jgi:hypothetical protein
MSFRNLTEYISQGVYALATGVVSFFGALFWAHKRSKTAAAEERATATTARETRITELERQVALLGLTVQPLSAAFQAILVKQLSHFHTPRIDLLLSKLGPPVLLTPDEEIELSKELQQRAIAMASEITDDERGAAFMLPYVVQRVRREAVQQVALDVIVVAVPRSYE